MNTISSTSNPTNLEVQSGTDDSNRFDITYLEEAFGNDPFYELSEDDNPTEVNAVRVSRRNRDMNTRLQEIGFEVSNLNHQLGLILRDNPIVEERLQEDHHEAMSVFIERLTESILLNRFRCEWRKIKLFRNEETRLTEARCFVYEKMNKLVIQNIKLWERKIFDAYNSSRNLMPVNIAEGNGNFKVGCRTTFDDICQNIYRNDYTSFFADTRFTVEEFKILTKAVLLPPKLVIKDNYDDPLVTFHSDTAFFFFCHHISTETPQRQIGERFKVTINYLSYMTKAVRNHLIEKWDHLFMRLNERRLVRYGFATAEALGINLRMANPERNCVIGFVDGTCQQIQNPSNPAEQERLYNGHKKYCCYKYVGIIVGGLIELFAGPYAPYHDNTLLQKCKAIESMKRISKGVFQKCRQPWMQDSYQLALYGDSAYSNGPCLIRAGRSHSSHPPKKANLYKAFYPHRVSVEQTFGAITNSWRRIKQPKQSTGDYGVRQEFKLGALLKNLQCIVRRGDVVYIRYPYLRVPKLKEYLVSEPDMIYIDSLTVPKLNYNSFAVSLNEASFAFEELLMKRLAILKPILNFLIEVFEEHLLPPEETEFCLSLLREHLQYMDTRKDLPFFWGGRWDRARITNERAKNMEQRRGN